MFDSLWVTCNRILEVNSFLNTLKLLYYFEGMTCGSINWNIQGLGIMRWWFDVIEYYYQLGYQLASKDELLVILGANSIEIDCIGLWMAK